MRRLLLTVLVGVPAGLGGLIAVEAIVARQKGDVPFTPPPRTPRELGEGPLLEYVVVGDSTAAGQGADYERGIAVATARHVAAGGRRVRLVNLAVSGATAEDVRRLQLEPAARLQPDLVLLAVGANDAIRPRRPGRVREDVEAIVDRLVGANREVTVVLTGSPELGAVPVAAQPLRALLGLMGDRMNDRAFAPLARRPHVTFAPIARETGPEFKRDGSLFAADGFHPSDRGYATWVPVLERAVDSGLERERMRSR